MCSSVVWSVQWKCLMLSDPNCGHRWPIVPGERSWPGATLVTARGSSGGGVITWGQSATGIRSLESETLLEYQVDVGSADIKHCPQSSLKAVHPLLSGPQGYLPYCHSTGTWRLCPLGPWAVSSVSVTGRGPATFYPSFPPIVQVS